MKLRGTSSLIVAGVSSLVLAACAGDHSQPTHPTPAVRIDEQRAKHLVLDRYRRLFADKFIQDGRDGSYFPYPPVSELGFTHVEVERDAWSLRFEPPSGVFINARVALDGSWTEILEVGYADQ